MGDRRYIGWGTLPYPTLLYPTLFPSLAYGVKVEGRGEVGVRVNIGWGTLHYPTLPHGVKVGYSTCSRNEMWGGRSVHWVGYPTLPYPILPHPTQPHLTPPYPTLVLVGCSSYEMSIFLANRYGPRQQIIVRGQPTIAIREIPAVLLGVSLDRVGSI